MNIPPRRTGVPIIHGRDRVGWPTHFAMLIGWVALPGCLAAPRQAAEVSAMLDRAESSADSAGRTAQLSASYWRRNPPTPTRPAEVATSPRDASVPAPFGPAPGLRITVSEFAVEFVEVQFQKPFGRQAVLKPLFVPTSPATLPLAVGAELSGIGRRITPMDDSARGDITRRLRSSFNESLAARGYTVVPTNEDFEGNHARAPGLKTSVTSPLKFLNFISSDTGVTLRSRTVAARRPEFAEDRGAGQGQGEDRIRDRTGAEVYLEVRLKVGTYRGHAAVEQGSAILWKDREKSVWLTARHGILSDEEVADSSRFVPLVGRVERVGHESFIRGLESVLPVFLELACPASRPEAAPTRFGDASPPDVRTARILGGIGDPPL